MRNTLLASAALLGLALAAPAFADNPVSASASNITASDTHSEIAPALPAPGIGPRATPKELLMAARDDLRMHRSGAAQEALERAETRMLDRSTAPSAAGTPDMEPMIGKVAQARDAIGHHDWRTADQIISQMLNMPTMADNGGSSGMGGGNMGGGNMGGGAMRQQGMNGTNGAVDTQPPGEPIQRSGSAGQGPNNTAGLGSGNTTPQAGTPAPGLSTPAIGGGDSMSTPVQRSGSAGQGPDGTAGMGPANTAPQAGAPAPAQ